MIIINADDWGRSREETGAALACFRRGAITSVTAMVFMEDSERAADTALREGIETGLHLNLSQSFSRATTSGLREDHERIIRFLTLNKYSLVLYNPLLRDSFRAVYRAQVEEFVRIFGREPTHIDGHHHKHLCANMLLDEIIPRGSRVRRNVHFRRGEKNFLSRAYRSLSDRWLARRYRTTDYLFSLSHCLRIGTFAAAADAARTSVVELMAHPVVPAERAWLLSDEHETALRNIRKGTYARL